jgi:hypothetical protein
VGKQGSLVMKPILKKQLFLIKTYFLYFNIVT